MNSLERIQKLVGEWNGKNDLYFMPGDPVRESDSAAAVTLVARGQFLKIEYTWAYEGEPQEGLLLIGRESGPDAVKVVWVDSWHTGERFMISEGTIAEDGTLFANTSYSAPPGPDWGWRTVIEPGDESFKIAMYNIRPEGEEMLAVDADYSRRA
jgi:hypothetical protein